MTIDWLHKKNELYFLIPVFIVPCSYVCYLYYGVHLHMLINSGVSVRYRVTIIQSFY